MYTQNRKHICSHFVFSISCSGDLAQLVICADVPSLALVGPRLLSSCCGSICVGRRFAHAPRMVRTEAGKQCCEAASCS